jgi:hypothetical protein
LAWKRNYRKQSLLGSPGLKWNTRKTVSNCLDLENEEYSIEEER